MNFKEKAKEHTKQLKDQTLEHTKQIYDETLIIAEKQIQKGIHHTQQLGFHLFIFVCRLAIFLTVFVLYILHREWLNNFMNTPFFWKLSPFHFLWGIFMFIMLAHLIPNNKLTMAWQKAKGHAYRPVEDYKRLQLLETIQRMNIRAWIVLLVWLSFNAIFGLLYLLGILIAGDLMMLSVFYYLCDYICILFYCPFQSVIMKNKCCINCRIYDWGHFMMFTPLLFIKNFYSWSLFFTSIVVIIHWEIGFAKHPERFWEGSNQSLQCKNCKEKTCQIKRKLSGRPLPNFGHTSTHK